MSEEINYAKTKTALDKSFYGPSTICYAVQE